MSLGGFRIDDYDEFGRVYSLGFWTMLGVYMMSWGGLGFKVLNNVEVYDEFGRFRVLGMAFLCCSNFEL